MTKSISRSLIDRSLPRFVSGFVLILVLTLAVQGHAPGLSAAEVQIGTDALIVNLTFQLSDIERIQQLDADNNGAISTAEFAAARPELEMLARRGFEVWLDGERAEAFETSVDLDQSQAVHFHFNFPPLQARHLELRAGLLASLPRGHKQYLCLRDAGGKVLAERILEASDDRFEITLEHVAPLMRLATFRHFLALGIEHIVTGYDHLAFLLALLLAGATLREVAKIITSFTVAHSVSLALATFSLVTIPPAIVEPLIAVSVIYVGLENLLRRDFKRRWLLTFGFGLIHGLGFASVLHELGIGGTVRAAITPLLSFNLGVEFGQIAIATLTLPLIRKLRQRPAFLLRYVPACSLGVAAVGCYWLIERTLLK